MEAKVNQILQRMRLAATVLRQGKLPAQKRSQVPAITPEEVAAAREFFPLEKFFIFGHARSGTTLLTRLVRLHPQVHCNYQGHFFTRPPTLEALVDRPEIEEWLARPSNRWNEGGDLSALVLRVAADFMMERQARPLGVKVVGDKSPNNLLNGEAVRLMHKIYPDGRLIFIVRDGRDAAISHRFQAFIDATQHLSKADWAIRADFEREPEPFLRGERSIFGEKGVRSAAQDWVRNVTETDQLGREIFGDRYLALRYEDLLAQPWQQMARLWDFLDIDTGLPGLRGALEAELGSNPDRDWQRHKAGDLIGPLEKGKAGSWREMFTDRDKAVFQQLAGEVLEAWGYPR